MMILDYFLLNEPQLSTALYTGLFLLLSGIIGFALRRLWIEGAAWGFLILAGSADLAIFISRALELPTATFGLLVGALCAVVTLVLRLIYFSAPTAPERSDKIYVVVVVALGVVIWAGNILHPLPDSGFSSHHGWVPLYIQESFSLGRFLSIEDMAFGEGLMTALFYPADLLGLVALSGWFGASEVYPAFNAGSITATLLMFAILSRTLKDHRTALIAFFILTMVMFGFDPFFRTVLGGNWGDVLMYLGGALVCYYLSQSERIDRAFLLAAVASTFLVFARHYGAFYSAFIISFCFVVSWGPLRERNLKPWLAVGVLWILFSARELYYLFGRFTQYYPGSWQAERRSLSPEDLFSGTLTDWGLIDGSNLSLGGISLRALYIVVLLFVLWRLWPQAKQYKLKVLGLIAPLVVLAAPLLLQILTGYRTNPSYSKLYILGIFIFAWYPPLLITHLVSGDEPHPLWHKFRIPIVAIASIGLLVLGVTSLERIKPGRFIGETLEGTLERVFEDRIVDREIVARLRDELSPDQMRDIVNRPIMYFYFEPGASIRLYLGGNFLKDLDFWGEQVGEQSKGLASFGALLEKLGYPNLYIGLMPNGKIPDFGDVEQKKFSTEIEQPNAAPWLKKVIKYGNARFFIVRKPDT